MLIHHFIESAAEQFPDKVAIIHDDLRMSYKDLNTQAEGLSARLSACGTKTGDRVLLLMENSADYIVSYYAALKAGAVVAPMNPGLKPDALQQLIDELEPVAIIASYKSERLLKAIDLAVKNLKLVVIRKPRMAWDGKPFEFLTFEDAVSSFERKNDILIDTDDLASIIYTSGSTGEPKGVMLSHGNIVSNTRSICQYLSLSERDIQMVVLPFFYVMGKSLLNTHMAVGGTVVINNRFMYPADVVHQMIDEKVTGFSGVPSTYAYLLNRSPLSACRDKLNDLRYCSQAGGHMARSLKEELRNVLPEHTQIVVMYGATEASARLTYLAPDQFDAKLDSIGKPIPDVTIRVYNGDGNEVPNGQEGEIVASGPNIMKGYWKNHKDTASALSKNGYHTGDIGYRDEDGFLHVLRRKDGLLKVGGHRVNPTDIEDTIMASGLVIETAVVGIPDKLLGTKLFAIVVFKQTETQPKELLRKCAAALPVHKVPSRIIETKVLPKNANGKVDKALCADMAVSHNNDKSGDRR